MEVLAQASNNVWNRNKCSQSYDEAAARAAIEKTYNCQLKSNTDTAGAFVQADSLANLINSSAEDHLFAALADRHLKDLKCAQDFAQQAAHESPGQKRIIDHVTDLLHKLRSTRQQLIADSEELAHNINISEKVCPLSMQDLGDPNPMYTTNGQKDLHYELCKRIITNRLAYNMILNAVPLATTPTLQNFIDKYANIHNESDAQEMDKNLHTLLADNYKVSATELAAQSEQLTYVLKYQGADGLDRGTRHSLLSDPMLVQAVVQDAGGGDDIKGLACSADARYGKGVDALNLNLTLLTLAISEPGLLAKVGGVAMKAVGATLSARAAGFISINSLRILQLTAFSITGLKRYSDIGSGCASTVRNVKSSTSYGYCLSSPKIEDFASDDCLLSSSLQTIGWIAPVRKAL